MALQEAELFEDEHPLIRSCPALNEIRLAQDIKDLTIEVKNGDVLHVHRIVLAARIPSLRASLSGPLGEENSVLRWPTAPLSLANALVQYVYTGRVEMTRNNVMGMIAFARMLELPALVNWGATFLTKRVNLENLPTTWNFAKSCNLELLADTCIGLMEEHFEDFVPTELFVRLPAETVLSLLRSDHLFVRSEEEVVAAIARWTGAGACCQADDERLNLHAPAMLMEVQWQLTTARCRDRLMKDYPTFAKSPECLQLILQVERWIGAADRDKLTPPFNLRPRLRRTVFLLFGPDKDRQDSWSVLRTHQRLQRVERVADMKTPRLCASYSVVGESIFVVGGQGDCRGLVDVDEFLVREGRWRKRASLAVRRQQHAAAVVNVHAAAAVDGKVTVIGIFGGCFREGDSWTNLASCEVYDVGQNRWHKLPDLPETRASLAAACLPDDSRIFVFGGWNGPSRLASVVFCNLRADWREEATSARTADFWQPAAAMRTARSRLAATPFRGAILVAGGHDGQRALNVVEMFSPPDAGNPLGQWTELAEMKQPRQSFTLITSANAVFALGNWDEPSNTVETLTAPGGSADLDNDLTSWVWSSKSPVETLDDIAGATSVCIAAAQSQSGIGRPQDIENRLMSLSLPVRTVIFRPLSAPIPSTSLVTDSDEEMDKLYDNLHDLLASVLKAETLDVPGEFNGHLRRDDLDTPGSRRWQLLDYVLIVDAGL
ncbi:BTB And C-terminal Kelch [Sparganum proliferum]